MEVLMNRMKTAIAAVASGVLATAAAVVLSSPASAASLVEVTSFGDNPGGMRMHIYVPDTRPANPAIVVAMHGCGGTGPGFYQQSEFARLADQYGYIAIYPSATSRPASATASTPGPTRPSATAAAATRCRSSRW
jgi:poly(3-hydroxybutyrate) depolymerase